MLPWRIIAGVLALGLAWSPMTLAQSGSLTASKKNASRGLAFSRLVLRAEDKRVVAVSDAETHVLVTEYLRKRGVNTLGAESLVFDRDRSREAEVILGGTVYRIDCLETDLLHCRLGVRWELLDVAQDTVVYRARVYGEFHGRPTEAGAILKILVEDALQDLLDKPRFRQLLAPVPERDLSTSPYQKATLAACSRTPSPIESGADPALDAVAIVAHAGSFGSAFFVSDGAYLLTAAHVLRSGPVTVRFRNGHESPATPVRVDRAADVALLRVQDPPQDHGCLQLATTASVKVGGPVYVLGSPASEDLAFSVTRGILSGVRPVGGIRQYQTDAAVSPGNSGGPLVDGEGNALGVTSSKLSGGAVEGIAFAISAQDALFRLGLVLGSSTDAALDAERESVSGAEAGNPFVEPTEARPDLDPKVAAQQLEAEREREIRKRQEEITPGIVPWLRWGGVVSAGVGSFGILATAMAANGSHTRSGYDTLTVFNTISWTLLVSGITATIVSIPLTPTRKEAERDLDERPSWAAGTPSAALTISLAGSVVLSGAF